MDMKMKSHEGFKHPRSALRLPVWAAKEATFLSTLSHPNIVGFWESFFDGLERDVLCIVMDYAEGGDLSIHLKARKGVLLDERNILDWFVQITLALKHIHDRKIMHRDLKTRNVFLTQSRMIKLGDFGIAKVLASSWDLARTRYGTPYYMSPEMCQHKLYNYKSDMWSLGCVLYEMATLRHAFKCSDIGSLMNKICMHEPRPISSRYTPGLRTLLAQLLRKDPRQRPSTEAILRRSLINDKIGRFLNEQQMRKEFGKVVPSSRHVKVAPPTPAPTTSESPSRSNGGPHDFSLCRRPAEVVPVVDEAAQSSRMGSGAGSAAARARGAAREDTNRSGRFDRAGTAEGADSSQNLVRPMPAAMSWRPGGTLESPALGATAAISIKRTPRPRVPRRGARKVQAKQQAQNTSKRSGKGKAGGAASVMIDAGDVFPPSIWGFSGELVRAQQIGSPDATQRGPGQGEMESAAKLSIPCPPLGPSKANTPGLFRPEDPSPGGVQSGKLGVKAPDMKAAVSPVVRAMEGDASCGVDRKGVRQSCLGPQSARKIMSKSVEAAARSTDIVSVESVGRDGIEASDEQADRDLARKSPGVRVASGIASGKQKDEQAKPKEPSELLRGSDRTERGGCDVEVADTSPTVGSTANSTRAATSYPAKAGDASGFVAVSPARDGCQKEPPFPASCDSNEPSAYATEDKDGNDHERRTPSTRRSRCHRGPRNSWLPNLKAQMDAVKAQVEEIESTPTRRAPFTSARVPPSPASLNRRTLDGADSASEVVGSRGENILTAPSPPSEKQQDAVIGHSKTSIRQDRDKGRQVTAHCRTAQGERTLRAGGRHVITPPRTAKLDKREGKGTPCVFCGDEIPGATQTPVQQEKLLQLLDTVAAVEKAAAAVSAVLTGSDKKAECNREDVADPTQGRRSREQCINLGEENAASQRLESTPQGKIMAFGLTNAVVNTTPAQRRQRSRTTARMSPLLVRSDIKPSRNLPVAPAEVGQHSEGRKARKQDRVQAWVVAGGGRGVNTTTTEERLEVLRDERDSRGAQQGTPKCKDTSQIAAWIDEYDAQEEVKIEGTSWLPQGCSTRKPQGGIFSPPSPSGPQRRVKGLGATPQSGKRRRGSYGVGQAVRRRGQTAGDRKEQKVDKMGKSRSRSLRAPTNRQKELRAFIARGRRERRAQRQKQSAGCENDNVFVWMAVSRPLSLGGALQYRHGTPGSLQDSSQTWCWRPPQEKGRSPGIKRNLGREIEREMRGSGNGVAMGERETRIPLSSPSDAAVDHESHSSGIPDGLQVVEDYVIDGSYESFEEVIGGQPRLPLGASVDKSPEQQGQLRVNHISSVASPMSDTRGCSHLIDSNLKSARSLVGLDSYMGWAGRHEARGQTGQLAASPASVECGHRCGARAEVETNLEAYDDDMQVMARRRERGGSESSVRGHCNFDKAPRQSVSTTGNLSEDRIGAAIRSREKARELLKSLGRAQDSMETDQGILTLQESPSTAEHLHYRINEESAEGGAELCVRSSDGDERDAPDSTRRSNVMCYGARIASNASGGSADGADESAGSASPRLTRGNGALGETANDVTLCGLRLLGRTYEAHEEGEGSVAPLGVVSTLEEATLSSSSKSIDFGNDRGYVTVDKRPDQERVLLENVKPTKLGSSRFVGRKTPLVAPTATYARLQTEQNTSSDRLVNVCKYVHTIGVKKSKGTKRILGGAQNSESPSESILAQDVERGASTGFYRDGPL